MRVLFVHPSYFCKESGVSNIISKIVQGLNQAGLSVDILTTSAFDNCHNSVPKGKREEKNKEGVYVFKVIEQLAKRKIYVPIDSFPWVAKEIVSQYDIVHLNEYRSFQNIIIASRCKKLQIPFFLQPHGTLTALSNSFLEKSLKRVFDRTVGYKTLNDATKVIALTEIEATQFEKFVPRKKISIIPNAINLNDYKILPRKGEFKQKYGICENEVILLFLGRIYWVKGVDVLIRAFDIILKNRPRINLRLVIAGSDDGALTEIRHIVSALKISAKVLFTGPLHKEEKLSAFVDSHLLVIPSRSEAFPMTLLEAYACGKPVVASNVGGLKSLVLDKVTGLLVESNNAEQLAQSIIYMLNYPKEAEKMGLRGKKLVEKNFSIERLLKNLQDIYELSIKA